ncbi:MAG: cytochrome b559 subunit alpha [Synechococcales cyanobacterium M58_A2018_015]|nr:cytochrome b559 subunit alpha [Synechococcales cyanobacterium M58_A2018_015]
MAGTTGERPLGDIVTDPQFWLLHIVNFPAVFLSGWLFVSTGLAYDIFGTPRPDQYYGSFDSYQKGAPIILDRTQAKQQLDQYFQSNQQPAKNTAPSLN